MPDAFYSAVQGLMVRTYITFVDIALEGNSF